MAQIQVQGGTNQQVYTVQFETAIQFRKRCCEILQIPYDSCIMIDTISDKVISIHDNYSLAQYKELNLKCFSAQDLLKMFNEKIKTMTNEKDEEIKKLKEESESRCAQQKEDFANQLLEKERQQRQNIANYNNLELEYGHTHQSLLQFEYKNKELEKQWLLLTQEHKKLTQEANIYKEDRVRLKKNTTKLIRKMDEKTLRLRNYEIDIGIFQMEKEHLSTEYESTTEKLQNLQKIYQDQIVENVKKEIQNKNLIRENSDLREERDELTKKLKEKDQEMRNMQNHRDKPNTQSSNNSKIRLIQQYSKKWMNKYEQLSYENIQNCRKITQLVAKNNQLEHENKTQKINIEELANKISNLSDVLKEQKSEYDEINAKLQELKSRLQAISISKLGNQNIQSLIDEVNSKLNGVVISEFEKDQNANNDDSKEFVIYEVECKDEKLLKKQIEQGNLYNLHKTCLKTNELGSYKVRRTLNKMGENDLQEMYLFKVLEKTNPAQQDLIGSFGLVKNKLIDCSKQNKDEASQLTINNFICQYYLKCYLEDLKKKKIKAPNDFHMERQFIVKDHENHFYLAELLNDSKITKYLGGSKPIENTPESQFMVGFSYYTYAKSQNELLISYLQAADQVIYDPFVCTKDGILSQVDLGSSEIHKIIEKIEKNENLAGQFFQVIQPLLN